MPRYYTDEQYESEAEEGSNQNDDGDVYPADALTEIDPAVEPQEPSTAPSSNPSASHHHQPQQAVKPSTDQLPAEPPSTPPHASAPSGTQPSPSTPTLSTTPSPAQSNLVADGDSGSPAPAPHVSPTDGKGAVLAAPDPSPSPQVTPLKQQGSHSQHSSPPSSSSSNRGEETADPAQLAGTPDAANRQQRRAQTDGHPPVANPQTSAEGSGSRVGVDGPQGGLRPVKPQGSTTKPGAPPTLLHAQPAQNDTLPFSPEPNDHHHHPSSLHHGSPYFYMNQPASAQRAGGPPHQMSNAAMPGQPPQTKEGRASEHGAHGLYDSMGSGPASMGVGASPMQHPRANGGRAAGVTSSIGATPEQGWRSPLYGMGDSVGLGMDRNESGGEGARASGLERDGSERRKWDSASFEGEKAGPKVGKGLRASVGGVPAVPLSLLSRQQMASTIQHSIEFGHTAQRMQDLHAHIETLTARLMVATSERDKAENSLVLQARQHQAEEQRLRHKHEEQLQQQQQQHRAHSEAQERDLIELKLKVERLQEQGAKAKVQGRGSEVKLTGEELQGLRQEMAQQEMLIQGFQRENLAAMQRIKGLESELKDATVERMRLALHHDPSGGQHHLVKGSNKETAARLSEILSMQKELEALREASESREQEMKEQIDRLRAEKKQLEAKQGGVDLKQMQEGDALVQEVKAQMEAMRAQYQGVVAELQAKVAWYAENQELLSRNDALVREQQDVIGQLEQRLAMHEGPLSKSSASRVHELQAQVAALQRAAKARLPPNSLAAVIEAAKPSAEESSMVRELQGKLEAVKAKLASKDEEFEVQLRTYQQQYEQLKASFERERAKMESSANARKRERELLNQVEEQRTMYTRKIRDLEAKLKQQKVPSSNGTGVAGPPFSRMSSGGGDSLSAVGQLRQREAEVARLKAELDRKTSKIAEMHLRLGEAEARVVHLGEDLRSSVPGSPLLASTAWVSTPGKMQQQQQQQQGALRGSTLYDDGVGGGKQELQQRYIAALEEAARLRLQLGAAKEEIARLQASPPQERIEQQQQVAEARSEAAASLRRAEATDMALATVQRAHSEAVERCALLTAEHQRSLLRIADEAAYKEGLKWQERLTAAEARVRDAQARIEALTAELADVQARVRTSWSPTAAEFLVLERRLDEMSREAAAREAKWQGVLEETHGLYSMQADTTQRRWELALEAKNAEIGTFKLKVQELLEAAARIQQQQQQQQRPLLT